MVDVMVDAPYSYYMNKEDDLGCSVRQHKPLYKGEHAQNMLSKVFDDPGMRPKVLHPDRPNKSQTSLITSDIWGATSRPKDVFPKPRNTNPVDPQYVISQTPPPAPPPNRPPGTRDSVSDLLGGCSPEALAASAAPPRPARDNIGVSDIPGTRSSPLTSSSAMQNYSLDATDIEGTKPGWKPPFRAHVGVNLRDPGLDVSDINNYRVPRNHKNLYRSPSQQRPITAPRAPPQQHAPPPARQAPSGPPAPPPSGLPASFQYTGLPIFQNGPAEFQQLSQQQKQAVAPEPSEAQAVAARLAWEQQGELQRMNRDIQAAKRAQRVKNDAGIAHRVRVDLAENKEDAKAAANQVLMDLNVSREGVETLWNKLSGADREGAGKLSVFEFGRAFESAGVKVSAKQMSELVAGLRDNVGLLPYRELAKTLLFKSQHPGSNPQLFATHTKRRPHTTRPQGRSSSQDTSGPSVSRPQTAVSKPRPTSAQGTPHQMSRSGSGVSSQLQHSDGGAGYPQADIHNQGMAMYPGQEPQQYGGGYGWQGSGGSSSPGGSRPATQPGTPRAPGVGAGSGGQASEQAEGGPGGVVYYPYKATPYWFSGNDNPQEASKQAAQWQAQHDLTHVATAYQVGLGDGGPLGRQPPSPKQPQAAWAATNMESFKNGDAIEPPPLDVAERVSASGRGPAATSHVVETPTVSSRIKAGTLTTEQLAKELQQKSWRPISAPLNRNALLAAAKSGASLGSTLKGPAGELAAALRPASPAARQLLSSSGAAGRPVSAAARIVGQHAPASFSAVANAHTGHNMAKLQHAITKAEIAEVRCLY